MLDIAETSKHFATLETMQIYGPCGRTLSASVAHVRNEYAVATAAFRQHTINYLDMDKNGEVFDSAYFNFKLVVKTLERKLTQIFNNAFVDGLTLPEQLRLVGDFQNFVERDFIRVGLVTRHMTIVEMVVEELSSLAEEFACKMEAPPLHRNQPVIAGSIFWAMGVEARARESINILVDAMPCAVKESDKFVELLKNQAVLLGKIEAYKASKLAQW